MSTETPVRLHRPLEAAVDRLHTEIHHLVSVQRSAAVLARRLATDLPEEPTGLAVHLADLLEGRIEPGAAHPGDEVSV